MNFLRLESFSRLETIRNNVAAEKNEYYEFGVRLHVQTFAPDPRYINVPTLILTLTHWETIRCR